MAINVNNNSKMSDDQYKLEVIGNNVLVKKITEQKFGSLLLINNANEQHCRGIVYGLGAGTKDKDGMPIPFYVKIGDEVFLPKYNKGYELRFGEESYMIIPENEIIAIIREKK